MPAYAEIPPIFADLTCDIEGLHLDLARWNQRRLAPGAPTADWEALLRDDSYMLWREGEWIETLRREVEAEVAAAPRDKAGFIDWFRALKRTGPGQFDPLFDWLARDADLDSLKWFLTQEAAGEAGFDDLVAMTQVKLPDRPKLELAANYWDEMGRGNLGGMHGPMLGRTIAALELKPSIEGTVWQSLALANTLTAFAATRRYAWHSVGALGVVELTAPTRVAKVAEGMKRLGLPPVARKYFELHAILDVKHADDWIANALEPLLDEQPHCARYIAEGALIRLKAGLRCFEAYRAHLWSRPSARLAAE